MGRWRGQPEVSAALRGRLLAEAEWRCQECGCGRTDLEIHHVIPIAKGGETVAENLIVLCRKKCHRKRHETARAQENETYRRRLAWRNANRGIQ